MSNYNYKAITTDGRLMQGSLEANSHDDASDRLAGMDLQVNELELATPSIPRHPVGRSEFLLFNQQLAAVAKARVPIEQGLRQIASDIAIGKMKQQINAVADDLEKGVSLEEAFAKRESQFSPLYGRVIKAGVKTGRLSDMLASLNKHLETSTQTRKILIESLTYPCVILVLSIMLISAIIYTVIPQFALIYTDFNIELPVATKHLLTLPETLHYYLGGGVLLILLLWCIRLILRRCDQGKYINEKALFNIPILGRIFYTSMVARMADAMSLMISSGADVPESLTLGASSSGSTLLQAESEFITQQMSAGSSLFAAGQTAKYIPKLMLYTIETSTHRDSLQDNLYDLGNMYEKQVKYMQGRLEAFLTPYLVILVGLFVGYMVVAMFMPMVKIVSSM